MEEFKSFIKKYSIINSAFAIIIAMVPFLEAGEDSMISGAMIQAQWCEKGNDICLLHHYFYIAGIILTVGIIAQLIFTKIFYGKLNSKSNLPNKIPINDKKSEKGEESVLFIPKNNLPEMWEEYAAWLEVINKDFSMDECTAILTKLEYEKGGEIINCLGRISNDTTPKLKLSNTFIRKGVSEKIFVVETSRLTKLILALENDNSKELPESNEFYFEVSLKGTRGKEYEIETTFQGSISFEWFSPYPNKILYITSNN